MALSPSSCVFPISTNRRPATSIRWPCASRPPPDPAWPPPWSSSLPAHGPVASHRLPVCTSTASPRTMHGIRHGRGAHARGPVDPPPAGVHAGRARGTVLGLLRGRPHPSWAPPPANLVAARPPRPWTPPHEGQRRPTPLLLPHQLHLPQSHLRALQWGGAAFAALLASPPRGRSIHMWWARSHGSECLAALARAGDTFFSLIYSLSYLAHCRKPIDVHCGCPNRPWKMTKSFTSRTKQGLRWNSVRIGFFFIFFNQYAFSFNRLLLGRGCTSHTRWKHLIASGKVHATHETYSVLHIMQKIFWNLKTYKY
jgi:hypothetical protein